MKRTLTISIGFVLLAGIVMPAASRQLYDDNMLLAIYQLRLWDCIHRSGLAYCSWEQGLVRDVQQRIARREQTPPTPAPEASRPAPPPPSETDPEPEEPESPAPEPQRRPFQSPSPTPQPTPEPTPGNTELRATVTCLRGGLRKTFTGTSYSSFTDAKAKAKAKPKFQPISGEKVS